MCLIKEKHAGYQTPALARARQPGVSVIVDLVRARLAFQNVTVGKQTRRELHPRIARAFTGPQGITVARTFLEACRQEPGLKAAAEEQGFDLDGFAEQIDNADAEARSK